MAAVFYSVRTHPYEFSLFLQAYFVGAIGGAIIGFLLWVLLTHRPVHLLFRAVAGGMSGAVFSLPLFQFFLIATTPDSHAASQYAYAMGSLYLLVGLPASAVLGMIAGVIIGQKRSRRRSQDQPQFRVE